MRTKAVFVLSNIVETVTIKNITNELFPSKCCQPVAVFLILFTKVSWPPDYLIVCIFENAIYKKQNRTSVFSSTVKCVKNICICIKKQHFKQKTERIKFVSKTTSTQRWSRSCPSHP